MNEPGYYLIETTTAPEDGAYTRYILVMVVDENTAVVVSDKSDVPTVDKAVSNLDADIGDTVTYYLAATLPTEYSSYDTYALTFNDTLSGG
ncbi:MAG: isopeptide-forming domain-containing fimbrial protein [Lachnospiraceae bacterium]|nr:isopeptide-forming domain-containing fimbrial protein [Lachnospiraceae bacterium]